MLTSLEAGVDVFVAGTSTSNPEERATSPTQSGIKLTR